MQLESLKKKKRETWEQTDGQSEGREIGTVNKRLKKQETEGRKTTFCRHFTNISVNTQQG